MINLKQPNINFPYGDFDEAIRMYPPHSIITIKPKVVCGVVKYVWHVRTVIKFHIDEGITATVREFESNGNPSYVREPRTFISNTAEEDFYFFNKFMKKGQQ